MIEVWAQLTIEQKLTAFVAVVSVLLGGLVSLLTTLIIQWRSDRASERRRIEEIVENRAFQAQKGLIKTLQYVDAIFSLKATIDRQFENADQNGDADIEPVQKVQEVVSLDLNLEPYRIEELAFLLRSSDASLLQSLLLLERRTLSNFHVVGVYNTKRAILSDLIELGAEEISPGTGTVLTSTLSGVEALKVNLRIAVLNNVLGNLMESLDRDLREGKEYLSRFNRIAQSEFGEVFPALNLEDIH